MLFPSNGAAITQGVGGSAAEVEVNEARESSY